jgi:phosphoenolpyruvate synthase/pyruvate phosphate dikinase
MELVRNFTNLSKSDSSIAGGKGASLGEMTQAGIPVPLGFVILSASFEKFLEETNLVEEIDAILHKVDHKEIHTVEKASEEIQALILEAEMPKDIATEIKKEFKKLDTEYVAVRSSATAEDSSTAAWAGQLDSFLNTTEKDLLDKVKHCWASLFTPRAIFYRFEKELHKTKISVAVVVQKMINSEKSGIAFSVHPVTQDYNQLIIEAGFGLGEAIVSGQITPDSYVVEKEPRHILDISVNTQTRGLYRVSAGGNEWIDIPESQASSQVLDEKQIMELSEIILNIEKHYGFPCDIEWAFEKGKFYIVQSRPITTLTGNSQKAKHPMAGIDWVKFLDRRRSCFIYHPYIDAEFYYLKKVTGFGYTKHLYKWTGDKGTHYRSASELQQSLEHYLSIVKNKPEKVSEYRDLCLKWDARAKELITLFEGADRDKVTLKDFKKYYDEFVQILLFTVTVPYLCMCGVDYALEKGEPKAQFKKVLEILDPLRGFTTYPKLERSMLEHFWNLISKKSGIKDHDLIDKLTPKEVIAYVEGGDLPSVEELTKRRDWCVFWHDTEKKKIVFEYDHELTQEIPVLKEQVIELKSNEIAGQVAYPGYAKGKVCRVDKAADMKKYQAGDIVVSINTSPDLMAVLSTASAIVSDEGGVMCHAAIVSRELKKPCIIGTKIATQVLHDGDVVEVDADNGVVRIISRVASETIDPSKNLLIEKARKFEWEHWVDRPYSPFMLTINMTRADASCYKQVGLDENGFGYESSLYQYPVFYYVKEIEQRNRKALEKYLKKKSIFDISKSLADLHDRNKREVAKIIGSNSNAKEKLAAARELLRSYAPFLWLNISLEKHYQEKIDQEVPKYVKTDIKQFIGDVSTSQKKNAYGLMLEMMENGTPIKIVHDKFAWMKSRDGFTDFYTIAELEEIKKNHKKEVQKAVEIPKQLKSLVSKLQELTFLRSDRTDKMYEMLGLVRPIFQEAAQSIGVTFKELEQYDIESILTGNEPHKVNKPFNCLYINGKQIIQYEPILLIDLGDNKEIKGISAYNGVVTGIVKIVRHPTEVGKVLPGDILVSQMTLPSFISAMQKAAAFVTDEGGITCHAAIISRELKKPCIIGTKIATKILKDGDMVEVDADKGVVRIIK